jgi:hypothetical protein
MTDDVEFVVTGSPRTVSRAIEEYAIEQRMVNALVVPWESDEATLTMSVTSARVEGWAIEHLNLGSIRLTDAGNDRTRVAITPADATRFDQQTPTPDSPARLFDNFARLIQRRFRVAS